MQIRAYLENVLRRARVLPGISIADQDISSLFGIGGKSASGVEVSPDTAISGTAVWCAIRLLSELTAMLPLVLFRRNGEDATPERGHPLYRCLHDTPNPEMTAMEFRSQMLASVLLHGNGFAQIIRNGAGQVMELWPLKAESVAVWRNAGLALVYSVTVNGVTTDLSALNVWHLKGFCAYGVLGLSPIKVAKDAIGLALAHATYASKFFANGARPSGVLEHPSSLGSDTLKRKAALENIRKMWNETYGGVDNAHKVAILEEGMKYNPISLTPAEAQLLDGRTFQLGEVARIFGIPPHMLADLANATFSNIEQQALEFKTIGLDPWFARIEQRVYLQLLSHKEQDALFVKHNANALLRGDVTARGAWYRFLLSSGVASINEVRRLEDWNGIEHGDDHLVQVNMTPIEMLEETLKAKSAVAAARPAALNMPPVPASGDMPMDGNGGMSE
jgi:HK97 family phage portal protein